MYILLILLTYYCFKLMCSIFVFPFTPVITQISALMGLKPPFHWSKIPFKPTKINLFSAIWKCKFCIYTRVSWLCSRPGFLSPQLSFKKEFEMSSIHGGFITWLSVGGGATLLSRVLKAKKISNSRLWKHPDHQRSQITSSLAPG